MQMGNASFAVAESPAPPTLQLSPHTGLGCKAQRLSVCRYASFNDVAHLHEDWDNLAQAAGADMFASFDWCSTWWSHFHKGRELEIYVVRQGEEIVACVPLFRDTLRLGPWRLYVVRLVGSGDAGARCHLAIRPDQLDASLMEIARQVRRRGKWDVFYVGDFPSNTTDGTALATALGRAFPGCQVVFRSGHYPASTFELPDTFDEYLGGLHAKERSSIRRTYRRLQEKHHARIEATPFEEFDSVFEDFLKQHEAWWNQKGELGCFRSVPGLAEHHRDFSRRQAAAGRLHLLRLRAEDRNIAYYYGHRFGSRIHAFSGSRTPDRRWDALSPGKQLHCEMVRFAIGQGVRNIDSMDGFFPYKQLLGAVYHHLQAVTVLSETMLSRIARRDFLLASRIHRASSRAWFWHVVPYLRRKFPRRKFAWMHAGLGSLYLRSRFLDYATDSCAADAVCFFSRL